MEHLSRGLGYKVLDLARARDSMLEVVKANEHLYSGYERLERANETLSCLLMDTKAQKSVAEGDRDAMSQQLASAVAECERKQAECMELQSRCGL